MEYCIAAAFVIGRLGLSQFTDEAVMGNPEVRQMMRKVFVISDVALDRVAEKKTVLAPIRIKLTTQNGREISYEKEDARGGPSDPLSWPEIEAKFLECTSQVLPLDQASEVINLVHNLEQVDDVAALTQLLATK
jgi:2-methylcitrate dehydratase PrpD